jgi:hypothetical protein
MRPLLARLRPTGYRGEHLLIEVERTYEHGQTLGSSAVASLGAREQLGSFYAAMSRDDLIAFVD